ncbi:MAG: lipopolysaccharide kinase InaA family protein [Planctomycetota bacterium]
MNPPASYLAWTRPRSLLWAWTGLEADGERDWESWLQAGEARLEQAARRKAGIAGHGRGQARRVELGGRKGVWRTNRHGGLLGPLLRDRFRDPSRLFLEVWLSENLRAAKIPTPRVLLALALRRGLHWRQHLVTEEVGGARTVFAAREEPEVLEKAQAFLEALFDLGLWAPDLHPGNLLWEPQARRIWIIDLAGARMKGRPLDPGERRTRRQRFQRFFLKHGAELPAPLR